jgi:RimJ/RimL family protein N-acetyltransferase
MTIKLSKFDNNFLGTIEDCKKIHLNPKEGTHYTIINEDKKVGIIGFVKKAGGHFLKIGIHQNFRGKGIFEKALKLMIKENKLKKIQSTISESNIISIKAHKKLGFKKISKKREDFLREKGFLLKRNIRMEKGFN